MYKIDYHMHTNFSSDSDAPMEEMIKSAISKGCNEIAITDHVDFDERYDFTDYNVYIPVISELAHKYKEEIKVTFGVEIGLESLWADKINKITSDFPFDFIIGSSHAVCTKDLYFDRQEYFSGKTKEEAYSTYFKEMLKNIDTCNDFCVYGHMDFISRYGTYEDNSLHYADYGDLIDGVLRSLIEKGKGIEINTSGFRYGIDNTYPSIDILKRYKELGGEIITVGSDAHYTKDVADHSDFAYDMLSEAGFKYISVFRNRKPEFIKL